ncbi:MAG: 4-phosphoerythronate dehydrogenase [Gammaproteobacteria bacterium]
MKIVADKAIPLAAQLFSGMGDIELIPGREIDNKALQDCDILLTRTVTKVNEALLQGTPVRYVASASGGVDHIDLAYLHSQDITFMHAPGCNARSVCEYVLSSLFCLQDQFPFEWGSKQIGIVGHGHVGSLLARWLRTLGCTVTVYDPFIYPERDMEEVLQADIITLHAPLTDSGPYPTRNMFDAEIFSRLKSDVILINTARGGIIREQALMAFLTANPDAHVILDVWADEPDINIELLQRASIATPHIAGYSLDAKYNASHIVHTYLSEAIRPRTGDGDPTVSPQTGEQPNLKLNIEDDLEAVKMAVLASYDARSDSAALQRISSLPRVSRPAFFDSLRTNYPIRREFPNTQLQLPPARPALREKLTALGFTLHPQAT